MMNFERQWSVISGQWPEKTVPSSKKLATCHLRRCPLLRRVPQASSLDQAVEIFCKISRVVSGALQRLRHKNHVEARRIIRRVLREMLLKQAMADAVNVFVHLQNLPRALQIEIDESSVHQIE